MCSIVSSFDVEEVAKLIEINRYRGELSHSITVLDANGRLVQQERGSGAIGSVETLKSHDEGSYFIVHQQAPTDASDSTGVHPAEFESFQLWHNGIIKSHVVEALRASLKAETNWDTELLLMRIVYVGKPDEVDGSFACLLYDKCDPSYFVAFRNEISPLYFNDNLTFSSTKSAGLRLLEPNVMWHIDLKNKSLKAGNTFRTVNNPYYLGGAN